MKAARVIALGLGMDLNSLVTALDHVGKNAAPHLSRYRRPRAPSPPKQKVNKAEIVLDTGLTNSVTSDA